MPTTPVSVNIEFEDFNVYYTISNGNENRSISLYGVKEIYSDKKEPLQLELIQSGQRVIVGNLYSLDGLVPAIVEEVTIPRTAEQIRLHGKPVIKARSIIGADPPLDDFIQRLERKYMDMGYAVRLSPLGLRVQNPHKNQR